MYVIIIVNAFNLFLEVLFGLRQRTTISTLLPKLIAIYYVIGNNLISEIIVFAGAGRRCTSGIKFDAVIPTFMRTFMFGYNLHESVQRLQPRH